MASTLLRRQLARAPSRITSRTCAPTLSARRPLSSTSVVQAEDITDPKVSARTQGARSVFDTHTVEDLHGMSAADILLETGTRRDTQMRHFTGTPHSYLAPVDAAETVTQ